MTATWWGGRVVEDGGLPLADDRGLLLGDGLFETILVVDGRAPLLARHLARLDASAARLGVPRPPALGAEIALALPALCAKESARRAALRVTLTRGRGRGLGPPVGPPGLVISLSALPDAPAGVPAPAASACVVAAPRVDPYDPLAGHKTLSAMPRVHARRLAVERGAEIALVVTIDGDLCEADAANLFVVLGGAVVTPSLDRGCLPGITRARCLAALAEQWRPREERRVSPEELASCEEAFVTSSLDGVRPLREIDGRRLVSPGPSAEALARALAL